MIEMKRLVLIDIKNNYNMRDKFLDKDKNYHVWDN